MEEGETKDKTSRENTRRECEAEAANRVVIPAKAGIQYSRDAKNNSRGRGVLDRPVKPDGDSFLLAADG
jgi:hypothetical protein